MLLPLQSGTVLKQVDVDVFRLRASSSCLQCTHCMDSCCQYGCDVNIKERDRILALRPRLEPYVVAGAEPWFSEEVHTDPDYETGQFVRTRVVKGACAFLRRDGRGCGIHAFAVREGLDYHTIKPLVCWLFPVTWDRGLLRPSYDVTDDLACAGTGPTVYEVARDEIRVMFGAALVAELDVLKAQHAAGASPAR